MSTATIPLHLSFPNAPAHPGDAIGAWIAEVVLKADAALRRVGQDRARIRAFREAAAVRALARQYGESDPGFASDLYAAADRHVRSI